MRIALQHKHVTTKVPVRRFGKPGVHAQCMLDGQAQVEIHGNSLSVYCYAHGVTVKI